MEHRLRLLSASSLVLFGLVTAAQAAPISATAVVDGTSTPGVDAFTIVNASKAGGSFDQVTIDLSTIVSPGQAFDPARARFTVQDSSSGLSASDTAASFSGAPGGSTDSRLSQLLTLTFPGGKFTPGSSLVFDVGTDPLGQSGLSSTPVSLAGAKVTVSSGPDVASGTLAASGRSLALINSAVPPALHG